MVLGGVRRLYTNFLLPLLGHMAIYSGLYSLIPWPSDLWFILFLLVATVPSSLLGGLLARYIYSTRADES